MIKSCKEPIRAASNFIALIPSRLIRQMLAKFLELNSKGLYKSSGKEKESCCLVFPSATVVQRRRQRNVQKNVMHVQSSCFAYPQTYCFFAVLTLPSPPSLLKLPNVLYTAASILNSTDNNLIYCLIFLCRND